MVNDLIWLIARVNLVLAAAIVLVLLLRAPARRLFGARIAYVLWLTPLLAAAMCFVPARVIHIVLAAPSSPPPADAPAPEDITWLLWTWGAGVAVSMIVLALRQLRFTLALGRLAPRHDLGEHVLSAQSATHGPAVIGVLRPVIVTPSDFEQRFDAEEQRIVLAHERAHMDHGDPLINAVALAVQCASWFNPLVHVGARALRVDQELACDAAVLAQAENARRRYAEAMLKTQLAAAVPIGCAWPPSDLAALKERIAMLKRSLPSRSQRLLGASVIALVSGSACAVAWAAQPPHVVATFREPPRAHAAPNIEAPFTPVSLTGLAVEPKTLQLAGGDEDDVEDVSSNHMHLDVETDGDGEEHYNFHGDINGRHVDRWEDLTPQEQDQIRRDVEQGREAAAQAREVAAQARETARQARDAAREQQAIGAQAAREAQRAVAQIDRERIREQTREALRVSENSREVAAAAREAAAEARQAAAEARTEQAAEVAQALAESRVERARAMAEAREEMAREREEARRERDEERARALEEADREIAEHVHEDGDNCPPAR